VVDRNREYHRNFGRRAGSEPFCVTNLALDYGRDDPHLHHALCQLDPCDEARANPANIPNPLLPNIPVHFLIH